MEQNIVYRHEEKYYVTTNEAVVLRKLLSSVMDKDKFGIKTPPNYSVAQYCGHAGSMQGEEYENIEYTGGGGYFIRSLYFDTVHSKDYTEKILGVTSRHKIRLRIYDLDSQSVKLEIKNKEDIYSIKETLIIGRDAAEELQKGNIECLSAFDNPIAQKAYYIMKKDRYIPIQIVDYYREAWLLPFENIRVTLDYDIKTTKDIRLFEKRLALIPVLRSDYCVMELKYNAYLPIVLKHIFSSVKLCKDSYSKYCRCRETLY